MMRNKSGLLLIFLGLLMTVVIYFFLQNRYISQSAWIKADVTLDSISNTDPLHSNVEDMSYYGVYYFNINGNYIKLCSAKVSDPKYIDNQMIFYINPNNYNDYHPQYEQNTKYLSLLALLISFIGIIDILIDKIDKKKNDMTNMFINCGPLDLSNFDTSNITNMEGIFSGCDLTELNLSDFDTSNINTKD